MDEVDVRILRELAQDPPIAPSGTQFRKSFAVTAKVVGLDEDTVRKHVRWFHDVGLIERWRTVVNPTLFGGGEVALRIDVKPPTSKDDVVEKLRLLPGVVLLVRFHGTLIAVVFRYYDEVALRRLIELVRRIAEVDRLHAARIPFPSCAIRVSKTDWDILRTLDDNPRKPYVAVSRELGLSSRTVRRALRRIAEEGAAFAYPALNPRAVPGGVMAALFVTYPAELKREIERRIATELDAYLWHVFHMLPYEPSEPLPCLFNLVLPNVASAREVLRWTKRMPGVREARIDLFEDIETSFEAFDEEMKKRIGRLPARLPMARARRRVDGRNDATAREG